MKNLIAILTFIALTSCNHQVDKKNEISSNNGGIKFDSTVSTIFLNGYVDLNNKTLDLNDRINWIDSNKLVSDGFKKSFKEIIDKVSDNNPLEADPVFDAQDYNDKGFEMVDFDNKTGDVILKGKDWPDFKISLRLTLLDGTTLVDGCGMINMHRDE